MTKFNKGISSINISPEKSFLKLSRTVEREERRLFIDEALFLSRVNHPNIVRLVDCGVNAAGKAFIATEKLSTTPSFAPKVDIHFRSIANELSSFLNVLDFLNFLNLHHGDIKPDHLLYDSNGKSVLIDFAQVYSLSTATLIGTGAYLAPELFWKYPYSLQSDMFSLGISLIQKYFSSESVEKLMLKYSSILKPWSETDLRTIKSDLGQDSAITKCLSKMISFSPLDRPRSGKAIVQRLVEEGVTVILIDEYDSLIREAVNYYIRQTHWFNSQEMIRRFTMRGELTLRKCHNSCQDSFLNNFAVLRKFASEDNCPQININWHNRGASICKSKYLRSIFPRKFPQQVAIPWTLSPNDYVADEKCNSLLELDCDLGIVLPATPASGMSVEESEVKKSSLNEVIEALVEKKEFTQASRLISIELQRQPNDNDSSIFLKSLLAYCQCFTEDFNKAKGTLSEISSRTLDQASAASFGQYYLSRAWCYLAEGNYNLALKSLSQILRRNRMRQDLPRPILIKSYLRISIYKWLRKNTKSALHYIDKALELSSFEPCRLELLISLHLNRSLYLGENGRFAEESDEHLKISQLLQKVQFSPLQVNCLYNLGTYYLRTGQVERGALILTRAYALATSIDDLKSELPNFLLALGNAYLSCGDLSRAHIAWTRASYIFGERGLKYGSAKAFQNLAELAVISGQVQAVANYLELAKDGFSQVKHEIGLIDIELLEIWCNVNKSNELTRIDKLLRVCGEKNYIWGLFQGLNLKALWYSRQQNWAGLQDTILQIEELTQKHANQFLESDLHYFQKLIKLLQSVPNEAEFAALKKELTGFLAVNKQLSYRLRSDQLNHLEFALNSGPNIFEVFSKLKREVQLESRIMNTNSESQENPDKIRVELSKSSNHLKSVREIAQIVDTKNDVENYVQLVLDKTVSTLQASRAAIFITSKYSENIELLGTSGCHKDELTDIKNISKTLVHHAFGGSSIFVRDVSQEGKLDNLKSLIAKRIKSAICIPLKKDKEVIGVLYVDSLHLTTHFEDYDKDFLDTLGTIISGGIFTSKRLQKLNEDYVYSLAKAGGVGLKPGEGLFLPSRQMQDIYKKIYKVAKTDFPVLLTGQSGSGKEVLARMIHDNSNASEGRFVAINCSAIPEQNMESELFGVGEQAFSGVAEKPGRIELADKGTLFLDEIGDMPLKLQAKLLRVLETKEIERLGDRTTRKISFRLISATNKNLRAMVSSGGFREDLYHRINDMNLEIPRLSERPEDLKVLIQHFYQLYQAELHIACPPLTRPLQTALENYDWPGGIRELAKAIARLIILSNGAEISTADLPPEIRETVKESSELNVQHFEANLEREHLYSQLRQNNFNIRKTARQLQMPESTLRLHIQKHNIQITPPRLRA